MIVDLIFGVIALIEELKWLKQRGIMISCGKQL